MGQGVDEAPGPRKDEQGPGPRPCDTAMTADPRNQMASRLAYTGAVATSRLAVPAGTTRSPRLSSSWYAVIPASPHNPISGRSRARGRRTPANGAASASATEATPSRATDNPAGPRPATATEIAGNALAHSPTVPAAAHAAARPRRLRIGDGGRDGAGVLGARRIPAAGRARAGGRPAADRTGGPGHRADPGGDPAGGAHRRPAGPAGLGRGRPGRTAGPGDGPGRAGRLPFGGRDRGRDGVGRFGHLRAARPAPAGGDGAGGVATRGPAPR